MKMIFIFCTLFLTVLLAQAQVSKGSLLIGGSAGSATGSTAGSGSNYSSSNFAIAPRISYAVADNTLLSMRTAFSFGNAKYDNGQKTNNNSFSLGLFGKKLVPFKNGFGWYPELGVLGSMGNNETRTSGGDILKDKTRQFIAGITPGFYYQPNTKCLINIEFGGLQYQYFKSENFSNSRTLVSNGLSLGLFQSFQLGFDFIIR